MSYWTNFASTLHPHPLSIGQFELSHEQSVTSLTLVENQVNEGPDVAFLIYGRTGWIGGMPVGFLKSNHRYFYGSARLHDRQGIEADITV